MTEDEGSLTRFIVDSSRLVAALAEKRDDLADLVGNTNATARAIGAENVALARALGLLPTTLRRANTTFVNLRATLDDLDVLVAESKPATKDLAPFLRELRPLVADARPTIRDLRTLVRRDGPDNDLVEATRKMPALQQVATPAFATAARRSCKLQPVLEFIRPYTPEFAGWLRDFGQGASNYDANGHYARIQPIFNAFNFNDNPAGGVLTPIPPSQRFDGLETNQLRRCPGARVAGQRRRLGAVARRQRQPRLRPQPGAAGAMRAAVPVAAVLIVAAAGGALPRHARGGRRLPRARDLRQRRLHHPRRGRQGRGRQGRLDRGRRGDARVQGRGRAARSTTRATRTSAPTRRASSARSR